MDMCFGFFFKQKTAYDRRISDCSSDVCSSDLCPVAGLDFPPVLNSTEPAEIMYGKAAPALRYGSSSLSLFSARTGIYARQYRHRQPRIRQSRSEGLC